jgi:hypothetical protein
MDNSLHYGYEDPLALAELSVSIQERTLDVERIW